MFNLKSYVSKKYIIFIFSSFVLLGCYGLTFREMYRINSFLQKSFNNIQYPTLGVNFLGISSNHNGKEKIDLLDLQTMRRISMPGINRFDSTPISLSISANGSKLAFITKRDDQVQAFIYFRKTAKLQRLYLSSKGIPRRITMDGLGILLAVELSRNGRNFVEFVKIPG